MHRVLRSGCWRISVLFVVTAAVFGCATNNGPNFVSVMQAAGAPKPGQARVVLYTGSMTGGWPIKLDGELIGETRSNSFMYRDVPAGPHQLSCEVLLYPGISRGDFNAVPGRTHYFL